MRAKTLQRLDELFLNAPVLLGRGPVPEVEIDAAEAAVGVQFSRDYRDFVGRYGGAVVGSLPIFGLRRAEVMADEGYSVVDATARFRADGWEPTASWAVISMDLGGNPIGLTSAGEIRISDHDAGETTKIAATFEDFVVQLLDT